MTCSKTPAVGGRAGSPGSAPSRTIPRSAQTVGRTTFPSRTPHTPASSLHRGFSRTSQGMTHSPFRSSTAVQLFQPARNTAVGAMPSQSGENWNRTG